MASRELSAKVSVTCAVHYPLEEGVLHDDELERRAINDAIRVEPYDADWPGRFVAERDRLTALAPALMAIEHIGSTAVPGLAAKPIIDIMAAVPSLDVADQLVHLFCANGYITSAEFNRNLHDRRWLMRHAGGRRTHHLHLLLAGSAHWTECIRFRELVRRDGKLMEQYADLKRTLADAFGSDREGYGNAKATFITSAIRTPSAF
jgi:GrpB-like predicted nucleotidyltransferase (UPF0157 family)